MPYCTLLRKGESTQSAVCEYFQLYGQSGMGVQTLPVCLDVVPFKVKVLCVSTSNFMGKVVWECKHSLSVWM